MTALRHLRVLDLTQYRAGPFATKLLAQFGATVIKVERPDGGDPARRLGPASTGGGAADFGPLFRYLNAGKLGITLNLKNPKARDLLDTLCSNADVVIESYRPSVRERLGIERDRLSMANRRLVMTSLSNFGQTGPYRDWRASEVVLQALGGLMYVTGVNSREPLALGFAQAQYIGGILAATATLASVVGARMQGEGDHVDVSIQEAIAAGLQSVLMYYSFMGAVRWRQHQAINGHNDVFPCKDGYLVPGIGGFGDWETYASCLDLPELVDDRFINRDARFRNGPALVAILEERLKDWSAQELFHHAQAWGFPFGVVQEPDDLLKCPQLADRGFWQQVDDPELGSLLLPGAPFRMSDSAAEPPGPAPRLGEHNRDVFGALGLNESALEDLRSQGVI